MVPFQSPLVPRPSNQNLLRSKRYKLTAYEPSLYLDLIRISHMCSVQWPRGGESSCGGVPARARSTQHHPCRARPARYYADLRSLQKLCVCASELA